MKAPVALKKVGAKLHAGKMNLHPHRSRENVTTIYKMVMEETRWGGVSPGIEA
jgi:hypothetical protein